MAQLFQHLFYCHQQGFFLLFLLWIWMSQNSMYSLVVSLCYCHKLPNVFCRIITVVRLCIGITISRFATFSTRVLFIWLVQLLHGAWFWNVTCLFHASVFLASASASAPVIVIGHIPLNCYMPLHKYTLQVKISRGFAKFCRFDVIHWEKNDKLWHACLLYTKNTERIQ